MATVTKPLALNESLNTTEQTPRNVADVLSEGLENIKQAIEGGGAGGHEIIDSEGNTMPQETAMQFADTKADYDNATEDGFHVIDDGEDALIGSVSDDSVTVTSTGSDNKNWGDLLLELRNEIDISKVTEFSYLILNDSLIYPLYRLSDFTFTWIALTGGGQYDIESIRLSTSPNIVENYNGTITNRTNTLITSAQKLSLYYGNKKAVVDLRTTASRCLLTDEETTVEQAMYVQSHGSQTVIEQSMWSTTTGDTKVTATHTGYLIGTFNAHSCNGGGAFTHGVIVFIDSIPVANIYSQGESTAEANSGSFCIPIKKGQVVLVRVNNGTWLGKAYIRY